MPRGHPFTHRAEFYERPMDYHNTAKRMFKRGDRVEMTPLAIQCDLDRVSEGGATTGTVTSSGRMSPKTVSVLRDGRAGPHGTQYALEYWQKIPPERNEPYG